eukprot:UN00511
MKKMKGVQLFMTQMVQPKGSNYLGTISIKMKIVMNLKATTSGGLTVPFVEGETIETVKNFQ